MYSHAQPGGPAGPAHAEGYEPDFRVLIEHSLEMLTVFDADGVVLYKSGAIRRELGFVPREMEGRSIFDFIHPDDIPAARQAFSRAIAFPGSRQRVEVRLMHRRGGWVVLDAILASRLDDPRVRGLVCSSRNITQRRAAEAALRESNEALQAIVLSAPVAIVAVDAGGRTRIWNPAAERIFGWTADEALGKELPFFASDEDRADFGQRLAAALRGEMTEFRADRVRRRKDGTPVEVHVSARTSHDAHGRPDGMIALLEDATEIRAAQQALRRSEEHLDHARRMDAIGRLAGGIAHDFNNLLTAMQGNLQLMELDVPPHAPFREELAEIGRAVRRATELTRQLLAFGRKQVRRTRVIDLNQTVRDTEWVLRRLIGEHIRISMTLDPELAAVEADPAQLEQVLVNMAVNARDAMPGGGELDIATRNTVMGGPTPDLCASERRGDPGVLLTVRDTGDGMDAETRLHAFEPFFTTKPKGKGTGLGLATVYGIVKQSDGFVWIESEPGTGTTVSLCLPAAPNEADPVTSPASADAERPAGGGGSGEVILLVEDEHAVRHLAERVLAKAGFTVVAAADGEEALRRAQEMGGRMDLLLTDVVMPGLSGPDVAARITEMHPGVPVLFMSGYSDEAISRHGVLRPGVLLLEKPFSVETLLERVQQVMRPAAE